MKRNHKLIAAAATVAAVAGGGAAFAAVELVSNQSDSTPAVQAAFGRSVDGYGLGGRIGGRGFDGGLGAPGAGRDGRGFLGDRLGAAAGYLGLSSAALAAELRDGRTLAQIAKARGKSADGLVAAMLAAEKREIEKGVSSGWVTKSQAQAIESSMQQRLEALVDQTGPSFRGGPDDGPGSGGAGGTGSGTFGSTA